MRCSVCEKENAVRYKGAPYCNKHYLRMLKWGDTELHSRQRTNTYNIVGDILEITTASGTKIIADSEDYEKLSKYSWCISKTNYAVANINGKVTKMHRYILNINGNEIVDHKNGNTLDNRKANIRLCTLTENARNRKIVNKYGCSGIKETKSGNFYTRITVNGKEIYLGTYKTLDEAIAARTQAESKYYGDYSPRNRCAQQEEG